MAACAEGHLLRGILEPPDGRFRHRHAARYGLQERARSRFEEDDFKSHHATIFNDPNRMPITVLPQGEKTRALLGVGFRLYGDVNGTDIGPLKPFKVRMQYHDIFGRKKDREQKVNIRQFAGLPGIIEKSNERKYRSIWRRSKNTWKKLLGSPLNCPPLSTSQKSTMLA